MKIQRIELKPGDVLVLSIGVGNMPPQRARAYMSSVSRKFRKTISKDHPLISVPNIGTIKNELTVLSSSTHMRIGSE